MAIFNGDDNDNTINGTNDDDVINGFGGNDTLYGGFGNDLINGNKGKDVIDGDDDNDTLHGGKGNDEVNGSAGNDKVYGDRGNDKLFGGSGKDKIVGGLGKDFMNGDMDKDTFDFNSIKESKTGSHRDKIDQFERGIDKIDLRTIDAEKGGGNQKFDWIGKSKFHDEKGELRYKDKGNNVIVQGDVNGDGKPDFEIWVGANKLHSDDFHL